MLRFIAALDNKRGIADEHGIPWQGKLPTDTGYYRRKISNGLILMGRGVYRELSTPYPGGINYVATRNPEEPLRAGFEPVTDARRFLQQTQADIWNIGGARLFADTIDLADELYLTRIDADFDCTKFFPQFEQNFRLVSQTPPQTENGLSFHFEIWQQG